MNRREVVALVLPIFASGISSSGEAVNAEHAGHITWVRDVLKKISTLAVGSTRDELLDLFILQDGLAGGGGGTFVSKECPYFKIDVELVSKALASGVVKPGIAPSKNDDYIVSITKPYLEFSIID